MTLFVQTTIDVISLTSLYTLLAVGLALVFGIMRFINFAHGELIMLSAYTLILLGGQSFAAAVVGVIVAGAVAAMLMDRIAFRPIRRAGPATQLVASFALSFLVQSLVTVLVGAQARSIKMPRIFTTQLTVGGFSISNLDWITVVVAVVLMGGLGLFLKRTTIGIQMRAAAEDFEVARLLGVRANRVIAAAFAISGLLAGCAAIILLAGGTLVTPSMGLQPVIIAFVAVILGGLGNLRGAAVGAFALAFLSDFAQAYLPLGLRSFRDVLVFGFVIVIFLLRPRGILASRALAIRA
jgi:branched-chain amino acid transport system permease protein